MQQSVELYRSALKNEKPENEETPVFQGVSVNCNSLRSEQMASRGLEHSAKPSRKQAHSETRGTKSGTVAAHPAQNLTDDPLLTMLIDRWNSISAETKKAIIELAENA